MKDERTAVTFSFGDSPEMADELLALVLAGIKTATCGALRNFPDGSPDKPVVGRRDVVLDGKGRRAAVIETIEVVIRRFDEVDEAFAVRQRGVQSAIPIPTTNSTRSTPAVRSGW